MPPKWWKWVNEVWFMNWDEMGLQDAGIKPNHNVQKSGGWHHQLEMCFSSFSRDLGSLQVGDETSSFHVGANQNLPRGLSMEVEVTEIGIFTGRRKGIPMMCLSHRFVMVNLVPRVNLGAGTKIPRWWQVRGTLYIWGLTPGVAPKMFPSSKRWVTAMAYWDIHH